MTLLHLVNSFMWGYMALCCVALWEIHHVSLYLDTNYVNEGKISIIIGI
jgi:hypothetical protein